MRYKIVFTMMAASIFGLSAWLIKPDLAVYGMLFGTGVAFVVITFDQMKDDWKD